MTQHLLIIRCFDLEEAVNKKEQLKKYAVKFANELRPRLRSDVQADMVIYPASGQGAIVEVKLIRGVRRNANSVHFETEAPSVNYVLKKIPQRFVGGNIDGVQFAGTNISLEGNRILLIKGDDQHWSESDALADLSRVLGAQNER